ncbi:hypothetical protein NKH19_30345 [Mesorhizobium sp. M1338]|uniref:hypothetical protein n=1 Tax=unclassified Mesorhizobium TaxID=325217 RepID=UPI003334CBB8
MARSRHANSQTRNGEVTSRHAQDAKSRVMVAIGTLVDDGRAEWSRTATGDIELRLLTGEVFLLGELAVTRVA